MTLSKLPEDDRLVFQTLIDMPLATAADLRWAVRDPTPKGLYARLTRLAGLGLIDSVRLGFLDRKVEHYFITGDAQSEQGLSGATWHQPGYLIRLLERMLALEQLYPAARAVEDMGPFSGWEWFDDASFDAASLFENGWIALFYSGLVRTEKKIEERLHALGGDLEKLAWGDVRPRPGRLVFVTPDRFGAELVLRVARRYRMENWVTARCIEDGSLQGARRSLPSRGWVHQPPYRRDAGWNAWRERVRHSWWSEEGNRDPAVLLRRVRPALRETALGEVAANRLVRRISGELRFLERPGDTIVVLEQARDGLIGNGDASEAAAILGRLIRHLKSPGPAPDAARLLLAVGQHPGLPTSMGRAVLGEGPRGRRTQNTLHRLSDWSMLQRWDGGRDTRYRLAPAARLELSRLDRTHIDSAWTPVLLDRWDEGGAFETHEYGVMDLLSRFLAAGCPAANGWRDNEPMGSAGGIVPDGMVYLARSPFGPGWFYIEYERSARGLARIRMKMRGFDSPLRVTDWPVLVVCRDPGRKETPGNTPEDRFHQVGEEMGIRMLTTTFDRLAEHGPIGNGDCWRIPGYLRMISSLGPDEPPVLG